MPRGGKRIGAGAKPTEGVALSKVTVHDIERKALAKLRENPVLQAAWENFKLKQHLRDKRELGGSTWQDVFGTE